VLGSQGASKVEDAEDSMSCITLHRRPPPGAYSPFLRRHSKLPCILARRRRLYYAIPVFGVHRCATGAAILGELSANPPLSGYGRFAGDSGIIPLGLAKSVAKATSTESQLQSIWIRSTALHRR